MKLGPALLDVMDCHPEIALLGRRLLWVAILVVAVAFWPGCAHAPPPPPSTRPTIFGAEGEHVAHFFARILVDACTERETSEELIADTLRAMTMCDVNDVTCRHAICVWLSGPENCKGRVTTPMGYR